MKIWQKIRTNMLRFPYQSIETASSVVTYRELVCFAEAFSKKLTSEKRCAIYCTSELTTAKVLLGCLAAGIPVMPLSMHNGFGWCETALKKFSPSCIITDLYGDLGVYHISDYKTEEKRRNGILTLFSFFENGSTCDFVQSESKINDFIIKILKSNAVFCKDSLITKPLCEKRVFYEQFLVSLLCGSKIIFCSKKQQVRMPYERKPADTPYHSYAGKHYHVDFFGDTEDGKILSLKTGQANVIFHSNKKFKTPQVRKIKQMDGPRTTLDEYVIYDGVFPNADVWFCTNENGINSGIEIKRHANTYRYAVTISHANAMWLYFAHKKELVFVDPLSKKTIGGLRLLGLRDSNGAETNTITCYARALSDRMFRFIIIADQKWINASNRAFPIQMILQTSITT